MALNVTTAVFGENCNTATASPSLAQWDKGQVLQISGVDLPDAYQVEFSTVYTRNAIPVIGNASGVQVPNELLQRSAPITACVVLHSTANSRETEYWVTIHITPRKPPETITPDPEQQDVIDQTIAALQDGTARAEAAATSAEGSANDAEAAAEAVQNLSVAAETLATGEPATVEKTMDEETGAVTLTFGLPRGVKGDPLTYEDLTPEQKAELVQGPILEAQDSAVTAVGNARASAVDAVGSAGTTAVNAVNQAGTTQTAAVNQAGTTQVAAVNQAGTTQVQAVTDKGAEVIGSIPSDYSDLADDVADLSRHLIASLPEIQYAVRKLEVPENGEATTENDKIDLHILAGESYFLHISNTGGRTIRYVTHFDDGTYVRSQYTSNIIHSKLTAGKNIDWIGFEAPSPSGGTNAAKFIFYVIQEPFLDEIERIDELENAVENLENIIPEGDPIVVTSNIENAAESGIGHKVPSTALYTGEAVVQPTSALANAATAYTNGAAFEKDIFVSKITMLGNATGTKFRLFSLSNDGILADQIDEFTPIVTNKTFELPKPLFVPAGYMVYMAITSGNMSYAVATESSYYEYNINTGVFKASPIVSGFSYTYSYATVNLNRTIQPNYKLNVGNILKYKEINGEVGFLGRWYDYTVSGSTYKCTNNEGSEFYFKTTGATSVIMNLGQITEQAEYPRIAYSIDGGEPVRVTLGSNMQISLTNTTNNDEHIIRVVIDGITEKQGGYKWENTIGVYVRSITPDSGTIKGVLPKNRIGMFFGDSVTEGINALGTGANATVNSAINAFPWFCCQNLGAVSFRVGYGGTGLSEVSSFENCIDAMNYLYSGQKVPTYYPDFIVINYGINDHYAGVSVATYKSLYEEVIQRANIMYPGIPIFMVSNFVSTEYDGVMQQLASIYPQCYFVSTTGWNGETTDGVHLSSDGAKNNGFLLSDEIMHIMGYSFFEV